MMVGLLTLKLAQLQVYDSSNLAALARANTVHRAVIEADRGIVYDRHGLALVQNTPVWNLQVVPADLPADARQRAAELATLATLAGQPEERLEASLVVADPFTPTRMGADLTEAQVLAVNERLAISATRWSERWEWKRAWNQFSAAPTAGPISLSMRAVRS